MADHGFFTDDWRAFVDSLVDTGYRREAGETTAFTKVLSGAIQKKYLLPIVVDDEAVPVRIAYSLLGSGAPLARLTQELKFLTDDYRRSLPGWKTRRVPAEKVRLARWRRLQSFLARHNELIGCFENEVQEGTYAFNLQIVPESQQQRLCLQFVRALAEAHSPRATTRGRRKADDSLRQRDGWIRRFARVQKRRGWAGLEIVNAIQRELREGTWNERSRVQYNIANTTVGKIAGLKWPRWKK